MAKEHASLTLQDIYRARKRIRNLSIRTPLIPAPGLSDPDADVYLKAENLQQTGSFKIRGAINKLLSLTEQEKARGVVTVSSGNHGRAVSQVAAKLGIRAIVCLSQRVPANKVAAIKKLGAEVIIHGNSYAEAETRALQLQMENGLTMIEPFDDPQVIAGQGTLGLEILEDLPETDAVLVPLSGGGLISGIALAMKSANPKIRVLGVMMDRAPVMYHSLKAGKPVDMEEEDTLADALVGNIGLNNTYTFGMVRKYVDDVLLVNEEEIRQAIRHVFREYRLVIEGGAAVGVAALRRETATALGRHVVIVLSGGNIDPDLFLEICRQA